MKGPAVWLVLFNYAQAALGFSVSLWLAHRLGPGGYGNLTYWMLIGSFAAVVVGYANDRTLVRDLTRAEDTASALMASLVQRGILASLVTLGAVVWCSLDSSPRDSLPLACGLLWGVAMGLYPTGWYDYQYRMHVHAAITLLEKATFAAVVILLLSRPVDDGALLAILALLVSRIASLAAQWTDALRSHRRWQGTLRPQVIRLFRENFFVLSGILGGLLVTHVNQLLLRQAKSAEHLGNFALAFQLISVLTLLQAQILRLLSRRIADLTDPRAPPASVRLRLLQFCMFSLAISLAVALPLALLAPWLIGSFFRPEYQGAVAPLRLLCVWSLLTGPTLIVNQFMFNYRLNGAYFLTTISGAALAVGLGVLLVPRLAGVAVALALLISQAVSLSMQIVLVLANTRTRRQNAILPPAPLIRDESISRKDLVQSSPPPPAQRTGSRPWNLIPQEKWK